MGVCEYRLGTRLVVIRNKKAVGFTGWCGYEMDNLESEWSKVTVMLAKFGEFSNVGGNRTGGFGVTKLILKGENENKAAK